MPIFSHDKFSDICIFICNKINGFVTFEISSWHFEQMVYDVLMSDLERPPKNKSRKIIFKEYTGLTLSEKMKIVGKLVGRSSVIDEESIYQCMLDLHDDGKKITITRIAGLLDCSARTIYRNMGNELKKEKELLNQQL